MDHSSITEAVMFFDEKGAVTKEMLFQEFEAFLDGFVYVPEYKNTEVKAAYLKISSELEIEAVALFTVSFDEEGRADSEWNIPLEHMVSEVEPSVDLGSGPVTVVGRSNCPVSWQKEQMWDPKSAQLKAVSQAVKGNKLGILPYEEPETHIDLELQSSSSGAIDGARMYALHAKLQSRFQHHYQERLADVMGRQRQHLIELKDNYRHQLTRLQQSHHESLAQRDRAVRALEREQLKQSDQILVLKEQLQSRRPVVEKSDGNAQDKAQAGGSADDQAQEQIMQLQQKLQLRETELKHLVEFDQQLQQEVKKLQLELKQSGNGKSQADTGEQFEALKANGVSLVAFHPGAGHITLPFQDVSRYLEDPIEYVAGHCRVSKAQYDAWHKHYKSPVCDYLSSNNNLCGQSIERVKKPADFIEGVSSRCRLHKERR